MADTRNIFVYYDGEQVDSPLLMGTLACDHIRGKEIFSFEFDDLSYDLLRMKFRPCAEATSGTKIIYLSLS